MPDSTMSPLPVPVEDLSADEVARRHGIAIREVADIDELRAVAELFNVVWGVDQSAPILSRELLRALAFSGHYVAAAYRNSTLVGGAVGFVSPGDHLHSHIAGVLPWARRQNIGFALKLHQRQWGRERGLSSVTWTFDPLVRRNAMFNIRKLGVEVASYNVNFYGHQDDSLNKNDDSDRLYVTWALDTPVPASYVDVPLNGARTLLDADELNRPRPMSTDSERVLLVATPTDIEGLRKSDPAKATQWRRAMRDTLGAAMESGRRIAGISDSGYYVLT